MISCFNLISWHFLDCIFGNWRYFFLSQQLFTIINLFQTNVTLSCWTRYDLFCWYQMLNLKRFLRMTDIDSNIFQSRRGEFIFNFVLNNKVFIKQKDSYPRLELWIWISNVNWLVYFSQWAISLLYKIKLLLKDEWLAKMSLYLSHSY